MQSSLAVLRAPLLAFSFALFTCSISACASSPVVAAVPSGNGANTQLALAQPSSPTATSQITEAPTAAPQLNISFISPTPTDTPTITPTPSPTDTPLPATPTINPTFTPTEEPPTPTPDVTTRIASVPILLYHYIRPYPDRAADPLGYNLSVPPELFEQELAYLAGQGYTTIRVVDLASYLRTGQPKLPPKPIIITFDDGYDDAYTQALPSLRKYSMIGTFFIPSGFVDRELPGYLNWDQVNKLYDAGMEIGAHTVNHADVTIKTSVQAEQEIAQSRQMLEDKIGDTIQVFAFPYGHSNARTEQIAARYFLAALTTTSGVRQSSDALYHLKRIEVNGAWSLENFINILNYWVTSGR